MYIQENKQYNNEKKYSNIGNRNLQTENLI